MHLKRALLLNVSAVKKTVYSMRSLIGMFLGMLSFLMVALLGGCYIYRKFRKGKKCKSLLGHTLNTLPALGTS